MYASCCLVILDPYMCSQPQPALHSSGSQHMSLRCSVQGPACLYQGYIYMWPCCDLVGGDSNPGSNCKRGVSDLSGDLCCYQIETTLD